MKLEDFKSKVKVLRKEEGNGLREKYIEQFINRSGPFWERIEDVHKFKDGYCYEGYLWDCMKKPILIKESYVELKADNIDKVYVF